MISMQTLLWNARTVILSFVLRMEIWLWGCTWKLKEQNTGPLFSNPKLHENKYVIYVDPRGP